MFLIVQDTAAVHHIPNCWNFLFPGKVSTDSDPRALLLWSLPILWMLVAQWLFPSYQQEVLAHSVYPNHHDQSHHVEDAIKPFVFRMKLIVEELSSTLLNIQETMVSSIQPWTTKYLQIFLEMNNFQKKKFTAHLYWHIPRNTRKIPQLHKKLYG